MTEPKSTELSPTTEHLDGLRGRMVRDNTLQALRFALLQVDNRREELVAEGDIDGLAAGAEDLQTLLNDMRAIEQQARVDLARMIDAAQQPDEEKHYGITRQEVPGVGVLEVKGGWTRKGWRSEELLSEVLAQAIAEVEGERVVNEDGEVLDVAESATMAAVIKALKTALPITASLSWRTGEEKKDGTKTGLRALGFNDADWCERIDKDRLATIPKRA